MQCWAAEFGKLNWGKPARVVLMLGAAMATTTQAQTFTTLLSFYGPNGAVPSAGLVQGTNGDFYGTTANGGPVVDYGTIFKITPSGKLTTLHSFCAVSGCPDGLYPYAGLIQATNGDFYGTTEAGGSSVQVDACPTGCGTVFKMTPSGELTTLYSFCSQSACADGSFPESGLIQASNGDLYGTTVGGGVNGDYGTIFRITPSGSLTTLYSFCSQSGCTDGTDPQAGLVRAANGDFYGTTVRGGPNACPGYETCGTVFKMSPSGALTTLHVFCSESGCPDGSNPIAGLVKAANGNLYGTTIQGGINCPLALGGCGTVFEITLTGALTTLYSFCAQSGCGDGAYPEAGLVSGTDGNLYGTTTEGGTGVIQYGTIFKITPTGTLTTVYIFCSETCGNEKDPTALLLQATNGNFYGTTSEGGEKGDGAIFSLSVGLGPFVEPQTTSGKVGAVVKILGTDLTGPSSVTFNGTPAAITSASTSEIVTTVPSGATSGYIEVTTPSGTLSSNVPFTVLP